MSKNFRNNKFSKENEQKEFDDQIEGRNAVLELLESGKDINKIYITKGEKHGSITKIIAKAKERKIVTVEVEREKINQMAQTENAQGVIAIVPPFDYCEVEDILNEAKSRNEKAFSVFTVVHFRHGPLLEWPNLVKRKKSCLYHNITVCFFNIMTIKLAVSSGEKGLTEK